MERLGLVCFLEQRESDDPGIDDLMNRERFQISETRGTEARHDDRPERTSVSTTTTRSAIKSPVKPAELEMSVHH